MTADPYARLDAAYLLGALDAGEQDAYEAHLATCVRCRAGLADIAAIPPLLAGLDEAAFGAPPVAAAAPVPGIMLPRPPRARRERARRRWLSAGLGLLVAACALALIIIAVPSGSGQKPARREMAALVATPVRATIALRPTTWGTEVSLICWYRRGAAEQPADQYELVAHGADGEARDLGSWRLTVGRRVIFSSGTALAESQIQSLQITQPDGRVILVLRAPRLSRPAAR